MKYGLLLLVLLLGASCSKKVSEQIVAPETTVPAAPTPPPLPDAPPPPGSGEESTNPRAEAPVFTLPTADDPLRNGIPPVRREPDAPVPLATIRRSGCYGQCPTYEATIYSNGRATYRGKRFVPKEGLFEAQISPTQLAALRRKIVEVNYLDLAPSYPTDPRRKLVDLPTVYTAVHVDGRQHDVANNYLAPEALRQFEAYLDAILEELMWQRVEG